MVDQINTVLHTDLINTTTRNQVIQDINGLINLPGDIIKAAIVTGNHEGSNFLDNLVGTLKATDSDMVNTLTMKDKYKEFNNNKELTDKEKAAGAFMLANETANGLRGVMGIDEDVPILVLFADESKGEEAGAFLKKDGTIVIFLDPSKIDLSDSKQVYNGLMYELNHFNPINPYVYDKSEKEITQGYGLEEDFTGIGRKPINGKGNSFYDEVMKGSNVLELGNAIYESIPEGLLDFERYPGVWLSGGSTTVDGANKETTEYNNYVREKARLEQSLKTCKGTLCDKIQIKLDILDGTYKRGKYAEQANSNYQSGSNNGSNSGSGNGGSSGTGSTKTGGKTPKPPKPSENQPKPQKNYKESDIENLMLKEGYTSDKYSVVQNPSGGYEVIVYGRTESKNFDSFKNTNISVVKEKDRMGTMQVLTIAAIEKGMAPEYYSVSMQEQMYWQNNGSLQNGVLTYKDAYELGYLTKSEYNSTKISSLFAGAARGSEYLGYAYAGKNIYDYHLAGQGNQTSSILITGQEKSASTGIPNGFKDLKQLQQSTMELKDALGKSGLEVESIQVRGSAATGLSSKGGEFRWEATNGLPASDIDVAIEFKNTINMTTSKNLPGFIHPDKVLKSYPELKGWSIKWSDILGRDITPGGWQPGTLPKEPSNIILK